MEIRLNDRSKILFEWTKSGALYLQLLKPGSWKDGHGFLLVASTILSGPDLTQFLAAIQPPPPPAAEDDAA